jgi:hypothetical protein
MEACNADKMYNIEKLVGRIITTDGSIYYLVRWEGYNADDDTWEPHWHLKSQVTAEGWEELLRDLRNRGYMSELSIGSDWGTRTAEAPMRYYDSFRSTHAP